MTSILTAYANSTSASITITLTSLANGAARQSISVDNTSTNYLDSLIRISTKGGSAACTATLDVYVYAAAEGTAPVYTDNATGTDAAYTAPLPPLNNAPLLGQVQMNGTASIVAGPWGVAEKFGGTLPPKWGLVFVNSSGGALDGTGANHAVVYQGTTGLIQ